MARPGPSLLLLLWAVACAAAGLHGAEELARGRVIARVTCAQDPAQAYALYLPAGYDSARRWPVLFCFDPGAQGGRAVERFAAAAEKFGWVVAGSLNSRNGPWAANATAINAMVRDVAARVALDARRFYAAGLSGGARVACQLAVSNRMIQGVIACSAGFPGSEAPDKVGFALFGTAGSEDFNHNEMRRVEEDLAERKAVHRVVVFSGGHEWLPAALAEEALAWFELHAMRSGTRPVDASWIEGQLTQRRAALPAQPVEEHHRALRSLVADFRGLAATDDLEAQAAAVAASRELKTALKAERRRRESEDQLVVDLAQLADEGNVNAVRQRAAELRRQAEAAADSPERQAARRVVASLGAGGREAVRLRFEEREYLAAAGRLELSAAVRPGRAQTHFDLARAYAFAGDKKQALAALAEAVRLGFADTARIANEPAFARLRRDPEFVRLAGRLPP